MKKLISLVLALALVMTMTVIVAQAEGDSLTIGVVYKQSEVFISRHRHRARNGKLSGSGEKVVRYSGRRGVRKGILRGCADCFRRVLNVPAEREK